MTQVSAAATAATDGVRCGAELTGYQTATNRSALISVRVNAPVNMLTLAATLPRWSTSSRNPSTAVWLCSELRCLETDSRVLGAREWNPPGGEHVDTGEHEEDVTEHRAEHPATQQRSSHYHGHSNEEQRVRDYYYYYTILHISTQIRQWFRGASHRQKRQRLDKQEQRVCDGQIENVDVGDGLHTSS